MKGRRLNTKREFPKKKGVELFSKSAYKKLKQMIRSDEKLLLQSNCFPPKDIDGQRFYAEAYKELREENFMKTKKFCICCSTAVPCVSKPTLEMKISCRHTGQFNVSLEKQHNIESSCRRNL